MADVLYMFPLNTQIIQVTELKDKVTGLFLTAATVLATLYDPKGNPDPVVNNITMTLVPNTDATYNGTVPPGFNPAIMGGGYNLVVIADQAGVEARYTKPVIVKLRAK